MFHVLRFSISPSPSLGLIPGTPEIVLAPSDSEVQEGNTVIFTCVASGAEPPDIWWTRNGEQLYNTTSGRVTVYSDTLEVGGVVFVMSTLELCSVELSDGGEYACRAAVPGDSSRNDSVYFNVSVIEPEGILCLSKQCLQSCTCMCTCVYAMKYVVTSK